MVDLLIYLNSLDPRILVFAVLLIFILQSPILTFPGYVIFMYAGIEWGTYLGTLINYIGILLSAIVGYYIGLWTSSDTQPENKSSTKFGRWLQNHGFSAVIAMRLLPIIPLNVISVVSGHKRLNFSRYFAITAIFVIPWIFFWTFIGSNYIAKEIGDLHLNVTIYHVFAILGLICGLFLLKYISNKRDPQSQVSI